MEIQEEYFPASAECDAVVFGLADPDRRPRLILNMDRPPVRRRFTLGHELGHSFISWHLGTIICHTDLQEQDNQAAATADAILRAIEFEANGFASELLMPRAWLRELLDDGIPRGIERIHDANVSAPAACFAAIDLLPRGNLLVLLDEESRARYRFATPGADIPDRHRGAFVDVPSLDAVAAESARIQFGSQLIYWWQFEQRSDLVESDDTRGASEILDGILEEVTSPAELPHIRSRINGIVGSAKNRIKDLSPEGLHAELQQRFAGRPDLRAVEAHPDFKLFLSRKAAEISEAP
jgi:IrrE N-terminal-like domain